MALHRKHGDGVAHIPFYKDEKVMGKRMTVSFSLRLFVGAVVVVCLLFGFALWQVYTSGSHLNEYVQQAHASRVADQKRTNKKIDELACYLVANVPDSAAPIVPKFRHQYTCPAYGEDPNFNLYPHQKPKSKHPTG